VIKFFPMPLDLAPPLRISARSFEAGPKQALFELVAASPNFQWVPESHGGAEEIHASSDVWVVNLDRPEGLESPYANWPAIPIIAVTGERQKAIAALSWGASAVLHPANLNGRLSETVAAVLKGLMVVDARFDGVFALLPQGKNAFSDVQLTPREKEVLALVANGKSNRKIAKVLGISTHTVKFHVGTLLEKFDADTRTEVVVRAAKSGLFEL
jgi:DNA-binding NarL/FixJ family response regulator